MLGLGTGWEVPDMRQCFVWAATTVRFVLFWSLFFCKKRMPHTLPKRSKNILVQSPLKSGGFIGQCHFSRIEGHVPKLKGSICDAGGILILAHNSFPFHHATCCSQIMGTKIKMCMAKTCSRLKWEWSFPFSLGKKWPKFTNLAWFHSKRCSSAIEVQDSGAPLNPEKMTTPETLKVMGYLGPKTFKKWTNIFPCHPHVYKFYMLQNDHPGPEWWGEENTTI